MTCWYANAANRPRMSSCPGTCKGAATHAERQGDGIQRYYCSDHAHWRAGDVGRQHLRVLREDELEGR